MRARAKNKVLRRKPAVNLAALLLLTMALPKAAPAQAGVAPSAKAQSQTGRKATGEMKLEADTQKQAGKVFTADGHVDMLYQDTRLRADHVDYNEETKTANARGHVQLDHDTQHLEADRATYNFATERGTFWNVRGTVRAFHIQNPQVLMSQNPLTFSAAEAQRLDEETYEVRQAWVTVCRPDRPVWKFYAPRALIRLQKSVVLRNATFRLLYVPIIYLPYASVPAGAKLRQSGLLIPELTKSSTRGYVLGDSFYWAPADWMDATVGAEYLSLRGSSQNGEIRMKPWQNVTLNASYYGVIDRGLPEPGGILMKQGGHEGKFFLDAALPDGWRAVANIDQLSSLTFRLAFGQTFVQAVNSEVENTAFLNKDSDGYSLSLASSSYKNYLSASPDTSIDIRDAPELRASSVDREPWQNLPIYFGFDAFADAMHRETNVPPEFSTPSFVSRMEFAPNVTMPLHFGPWLDVTPTFTLRETRYGGQLVNGLFVDSAFVRSTQEFTLDVRPPSLDRIWSDGDVKWKHTIEPSIEYHYVNGVSDFSRYLLFDEDDTLTDTNDVQYGITQRLFRKDGDNGGEELVSWDVEQKYFFDPTFGGALVPGQRNVFQALDSLTPFAFADSLHRFSPIISDLNVEPGGNLDTEFRVDYDPVRGQTTAIGTLVKVRPYKQYFLTLADFSAVNIPATSPANPGVIEPRSNQVRAMAGYGDMTSKGWSGLVGFSYDISQQVFQNQIIQMTYNGSCCGIGFMYRRLSLGTVRNENQFGIVFHIANLGSVGNVRKQESIF